VNELGWSRLEWRRRRSYRDGENLRSGFITVV
jgi:hypothetical protein